MYSVFKKGETLHRMLLIKKSQKNQTQYMLLLTEYLYKCIFKINKKLEHQNDS